MNVQADLELRNLLPGAADGVKCCGVCGKPHARADKSVSALPYHAKAIAMNMPGMFRNLTKALGGMTQDFVDRHKFNAQLEWHREQLIKAREEHDAHAASKPAAPPRVKSDKALLIETLTQTLDMLGVKHIEPNPDPASEGQWSALALADALQYRIGEMLAEKETTDKVAVK